MTLTRRSLLLAPAAAALNAAGRTTVEIRGTKFHINGKPTYAGRVWKGATIEGLLLNSRMVQGIFDDENADTVSKWAYPDTGEWDAERNTREFLAAMPEWRRHGLTSFTINLQGGSPQGYSKEQPWLNSAFASDGSLKPAPMERLRRILDFADQLGFAPILGFFYFGQDQHFRDENAVRRAVANATLWLMDNGYRNVLVEIANECDNRAYEQPLIRAPRIHELINLCRDLSKKRLPISASFNGGSIPTPNVVQASDFILLHGNGVKVPSRITSMVLAAKRLDAFKPIVFNEDDHFDFDKPVNNFVAAVRAGASWGYFDPGLSNYSDGYQCPPVNWGINTARKRQFFNLVKEMAGLK